MTDLFGLALDLLVALLLALVAIYCYVLDRRLSAVREGQASLAAFLAQLTEATQAAERTIGGLKGLADGTGGELQARVKAARGVADELALLVESGARVAERLEGARAKPETPQQTLLRALKEAR